MLTDVQTPFLGSPLVSLKVMSTAGFPACVCTRLDLQRAIGDVFVPDLYRDQSLRFRANGQRIRTARILSQKCTSKGI